MEFEIEDINTNDITRNPYVWSNNYLLSSFAINTPASVWNETENFRKYVVIKSASYRMLAFGEFDRLWET